MITVSRLKTMMSILPRGNSSMNISFLFSFRSHQPFFRHQATPRVPSHNPASTYNSISQSCASCNLGTNFGGLVCLTKSSISPLLLIDSIIDACCALASLSSNWRFSSKHLWYAYPYPHKTAWVSLKLSSTSAFSTRVRSLLVSVLQICANSLVINRTSLSL